MIPPINDVEIKRQQRNLTNSQKKNITHTKEGVLVNSLIKDKEQDVNLSSSKDTYLISDKISMPKELYQDNKIVDKKLLPLSAIALGVMSSVAVITGFVNRSAKVAQNLAEEKWLPAVTRNVNLSKETSQVIYQMIQSPNKKTFIAKCYSQLAASVRFELTKCRSQSPMPYRLAMRQCLLELYINLY